MPKGAIPPKGCFEGYFEGCHLGSQFTELKYKMLMING